MKQNVMRVSSGALVALLALSGCYNSAMIGSATKVTGGRMYKLVGPLQEVEQQLLFDLQGLGLAPGEVMRNGGRGDQGMHYTLEYGGDASGLEVTTYEFSNKSCSRKDYKQDHNSAPTVHAASTSRYAHAMDNDKQDGNPDDKPPPKLEWTGARDFVSVVGAQLQKIDRLQADLIAAEIELKAAQKASSPKTLSDRIGEQIDKLDSDGAEKLLKEFLERNGDRLPEVLEKLGVGSTGDQTRAIGAVRGGGRGRCRASS